jgi:hypothetical protein
MRRVLIVTSSYAPTMIADMYGAKQPVWVRPGRWKAIPFSALPRDLYEAADGLAPEAERNGPPYGIVYVGGPVMTRSFTLLTRALSQLRLRSAKLCEGIRIELYGTMLVWKPGEVRGLADIAFAAYLLYRAVELPSQRLSSKISYRRPSVLSSRRALLKTKTQSA